MGIRQPEQRHIVHYEVNPEAREPSRPLSLHFSFPFRDVYATLPSVAGGAEPFC
jgi:hypothetical protein